MWQFNWVLLQCYFLLTMSASFHGYWCIFGEKQTNKWNKGEKKPQQKQPTKKSQTCNMQWRFFSFWQRKTIPVVLRHFRREEFFAIWCLLWCSEVWSNTRGRWNWRMSYEELPHHRKHSQEEDSCCYELLKTSEVCSFLSRFQKPEMAFPSIFFSLLSVFLPLKEGLQCQEPFIVACTESQGFSLLLPTLLPSVKD